MQSFLNKIIAALVLASLVVALHSVSFNSLQIEESEISTLFDEENSDDCENKMKLATLGCEELKLPCLSIKNQISFLGFAVKEADLAVPTSPPNA